MRPREPEPTEIEKTLQPVVDEDERIKGLKKLAGALHTETCPVLTGAGFCDCSEDSSLHKDLKELALNFAKSSMASATDVERLIFAHILLTLLKKAWRAGHKWFADSDPKLQEQARDWLHDNLILGGHSVGEMTESLFDLLKAVEDKAWMRLSAARTKQWSELEELLEVKGGTEVVRQVRGLIAKEKELQDINDEMEKFTPPDAEENTSGT